MAGDILIKHGVSPVSVTITLDSLGSASTAVSDAINVTTADQLDDFIEVVIDPGTTSGNKQALLYVLTSIDGTNYSDSTNYTTNAYPLGYVYLPDTNIVRSKAFSVAAACGGTLPPYYKVLVLNDSGAAFNSTGNSMTRLSVFRQYT